MSQTHFEVDAASINALATGLGAIVFAVVRRLPPGEREAFANDLAAMAQAQNDVGQPIAETLLIDLHRAAVLAAGVGR